MDMTVLSANRTARAAALLYLLMVPLGAFGIMYIPEAVWVPGDAATTASRMLEAEGLYRFSLMSALLVQIVNIVVAFLLHRLLRSVNLFMAHLMVVFILVGVPIAMFNKLNAYEALLLADSHKELAFDSAERLLQLLTLHEAGDHIAGLFWGLWLLPMGLLVYQSGFLPRIIGLLLVVGCGGYLVDSLAYFLMPESNISIGQFTFIGEILLPLWLLIKGVDREGWHQQMVLSIQN